MYSYYWHRMENDQGDLSDIIRASGGGGGSMNNPAIDWQFPSEPMNLSTMIEEPADGFGDPFSNMQDPLLYHELDFGRSVFFNNSESTGLVKMNAEEDDTTPSQKILGEEMKGPLNIFSRMLQISPNAKMSSFPHSSNSSPPPASPRGIKPSSLDANDMIKSNNASCLVENSAMQIPLPRNPGIKRRKGQTKKVVCIPAPASTNNRSSGEVVPSDHWAWRKYGQKPIKGSPYPRGYYRCSSSKGCSARKQVERSRNDPNMLVITYTSEHNHPWPTQRNALAGSTRTQPMKKDSASKSSSSTPKSTNSKEEPMEMDKDNVSAIIAGGSSSVTTVATVKEEMGEMEKPMMDLADHEFDQDFNHQSSNQSDDFFADLGELEPDPLDIMFSQGFTGVKSEEDRGNKALDPFSLVDWSGNSIGEAGKGL